MTWIDEQRSWREIAQDWQDPGRGAPLAALASGAWKPPLTAEQCDEVWQCLPIAITSPRDRLILRLFVCEQEGNLAAGRQEDPR